VRATVSRFEIPARDPERVARFYREVFGWEIEALPWDGPAYFRVRAAVADPGAEPREGIDGGVTEAAAGEPEHPLLVVHIAGATVEECLARIVAAGGAVDLPAAAVGTMGRFARFRDPEGNRLGLWQAL